MTKRRDDLPRRRLLEAAEHQPTVSVLAKLLLDLGGIQLVAPPTVDSAVPRLLEAGFVMAGPVHCKPMKVSNCHANVARLWTRQKQEVVAIGTGYALSGDGLWRQHSWVVLREGILDTTVPRTKYFGLLLQGWEADSFAEVYR